MLNFIQKCHSSRLYCIHLTICLLFYLFLKLFHVPKERCHGELESHMWHYLRKPGLGGYLKRYRPKAPFFLLSRSLKVNFNISQIGNWLQSLDQHEMISNANKGVFCADSWKETLDVLVLTELPHMIIVITLRDHGSIICFWTLLTFMSSIDSIFIACTCLIISNKMIFTLICCNTHTCQN